MTPTQVSGGRAEGMPPEALYMELEGLLVRLGVEIHIEPFDEDSATSGGLCLLYGKSLLIVDSKTSLMERNRLILDCLRTFDLEGIYTAPYIREQIGRLQPGGGRPKTFDTDPASPDSIP